METIEIFKEVFGEDVFTRKREREIVYRRIAAYTFMNKMLGIECRDIAKMTGRSYSAVIAGIKQFEELLDKNDDDAVELWKHIYDGVAPIIAQQDSTYYVVNDDVNVIRSTNY